jgi:dTDP-4-amino-4,6-dideoxygalactose transaminase
MARRQLPVLSPIAPAALGGALGAVLMHRRRALADVAASLTTSCGARQTLLTNSGTSALVLALRLAVGEGKTVAFPGYACVDLAAAARFAKVHVRLYDLDPRTLSPDLGSVAAVLSRGVNAVVVAHLHGFPADVPAVSRLAAQAGVPVIEDAAQAAGGTLLGRPLGSFGALSVFSFGRGKGMSGGHGGALVCRDERFVSGLKHAGFRVGRPGWGWADVATAAAQWAFGRPSLYALPSALPGLRLGEMVYHPAREPRSLSIGAAALVGRALRTLSEDVSLRRRNATALYMAATEGSDIEPITLLPGATSGFLRFPVVDSGGRVERPDMGIVRGYPRTLHEQDELRPCLMSDEPVTPGATMLREGLFTLPTHERVDADDIERMGEWLRVPTRVLMTFAPRSRRTEGSCRSA